jgi:large subunit ribosomal protein L9
LYHVGVYESINLVKVMKVILLRDVAKIGRRHEIIEVSDGLALNKLIPKKDAEIATPDKVRRIMNLREKGESNRADTLAGLKAVADKLTATPITISKKANEQGHLFESVHAEDVVAEARKIGVVIQKDQVVIDGQLKTVGDHTVTLKTLGESHVVPIIVKAK